MHNIIEGRETFPGTHWHSGHSEGQSGRASLDTGTGTTDKPHEVNYSRPLNILTQTVCFPVRT